MCDKAFQILTIALCKQREIQSQSSSAQSELDNDTKMKGIRQVVAAQLTDEATCVAYTAFFKTAGKRKKTVILFLRYLFSRCSLLECLLTSVLPCGCGQYLYWLWRTYFGGPRTPDLIGHQRPFFTQWLSKWWRKNCKSPKSAIIWRRRHQIWHSNSFWKNA